MGNAEWSALLRIRRTHHVIAVATVVRTPVTVGRGSSREQGRQRSDPASAQDARECRPSKGTPTERGERLRVNYTIIRSCPNCPGGCYKVSTQKITVR